MNNRILIFSLLLVIFTASDAVASFRLRGPHTLSFGPEVYYVKRTREGGTSLDGVMYGAYLSYERLRRCSIYWGINYSAAYGQLSGESADNFKQKSWLFDETVEGRIGYNYGSKRWKRPYIVPFIGYGYFYQSNRFVNPSPLKVKFRNTFPFASCGILTGFCYNKWLSAALLLSGKWMINGRHRITGDESFDNITLSMEEKWQYEIELPIEYKRSFGTRCLNFSLVPFFRLRQYGGKMDFPFDFVETTFRNYGARLVASYDF